MTKVTPRSIKEYFKVVPRSEPKTPREDTSKQKDIILLSSDEENKTTDNRPKLLKFEPRKAAMRRVTVSDAWFDDNSDSDPPTTEVAHVRTLIKSSTKRRPLNEDSESLADSQEVQPKKTRRSTINLINDSDGEVDYCNDSITDCSLENEIPRTECSQVEAQSTDEYRPGTQSSQSSSDSSESGAESYTECELESDDSFKAPDPWNLYQSSGKRKKSTNKTMNQGSASYEDNQEVSIHKINLNHHKLIGMSVEKVIKVIVDEYNEGRNSNSSDTKSTFEEMYVDHEPVVKPEDEEHFNGDSFSVKVYVQKVARKIPLLHSYGIKEKAITIHSLIFHYREAELFAVTTNQAWNVVQWCLDFDFPDIIAARILSKDGESRSTTKALVGTELTRNTTHKQQKKTNPHDVLTLCTRYTADLRDNASILRLSCFQKSIASTEPVDEENGEDGEEEDREAQSTKPFNKIKLAKVTVSVGNIRIHKRFSTSDLLSILSILSEISNDKKTYNLNDEIEQNSTAHKKYLANVHTDRVDELNLQLSKIIHNAIADDNKMAELENFQLCHKHTSDFFSGYDFKLMFRGDEIKIFSETPTIKQIVVELRDELGEVSANSSDVDFLKRLNNAKISYKFRNKEKKAEKLLNFIDGLLTDGTDTVFWHVMGKWCKFQDGYIHLVHNQFKKILNDYLLTDKNDPAFLRIRWSTNLNMSPELKLQNYLEKFSNDGRAWISERPERDIVDMIRIGKDGSGRNTFFVYYFLPDLNTKTNVKCNRVAESIMQIGKANMQIYNQNADVAGSEDVKEQLKDVYKKLSQQRVLKSICPNFRQFLQMMAEAKFYLAIGRNATVTSVDIPSLADEKEVGKEITSSDIADILENLFDTGLRDDREMVQRTALSLKERFDECGSQRLAEFIHRRLSENEYIETDGNSIREKLLSVNRNNFEITTNRRVNQFLYDKIISKFQPRACTVLSKLGFIEFSHEIAKLTIKSFNLIEIPLQ